MLLALMMPAGRDRLMGLGGGKGDLLDRHGILSQPVDKKSDDRRSDNRADENLLDRHT